ncbi:hypothetical protein C8R41DRAFT_854279 [Lentinula lateritia]|uniref:Uncharacterized protein n=1 Tax=Lentinula lateritia TaxID=40482 RepID=A0ABQ8V0R0_9AGAR|nr:hypothetical protein C8R41DRAFT_854279 [Lentinula lateritia]
MIGAHNAFCATFTSWLASASLLDWTAIITMPINSKVIPVLKTVTWKMTMSVAAPTNNEHHLSIESARQPGT